MQDTFRTNACKDIKFYHWSKDIKFYHWRLIPDVKGNNFEPFVDRITKSKQSYFITGKGGGGKTTLLKQLQSYKKNKIKSILLHVLLI